MSFMLSAQTDLGTRTLAEIAASLPGAITVFRQHKLDFCCCGEASLAEAAAGKGLALSELEAALHAVAQQALPATLPEEAGALITLIETRYHAVHRQELPEVIRLARRVEGVHGARPDAPSGAADLLQQTAEKLEAHMKKEELILFPMMRRGGHPMIAQPIAVMLAEHGDHGGQLRELARIMRDFEAPDDACPTWRALCAGSRKLHDDLVEHIHIENNLLFPRFTA